VLAANDAERVQIRAYYSFIPGVFCFDCNRCLPAVQQLSPDSFPEQTEIQRARFFGNKQPVAAKYARWQHYGNHICFFNIDLAACTAAQMEQSYMLTTQ
jgi:hypothetical protein